MQRLYYLAADVDTTQRVSDALHEEGIGDWNFHVLAKDEAGLYTHHVHSATTYQQLDIIRTGQRWGLAGGGIGLGIGLVCYALQPLPWESNALTVALMALIGGLFGAWQGGMIGLTRESYKIAPFHDDIEAGRYLIMVDVKREHRTQIRELMDLKFPMVQRCGSSSTFINPLDRPAHLHHQNTH
jgi:hypothetical protein